MDIEQKIRLHISNMCTDIICRECSTLLRDSLRELQHRQNEIDDLRKVAQMGDAEFSRKYKHLRVP